MRTALMLLLLTALAAVPGSVIPQAGVDALKTSRWQDAHPTLTPIYERLGLFDVYGSPWFAAIYLLLMVSLVGCIIPRLGSTGGRCRAAPPAAPRRLDRLPATRRTPPTSRPRTVLDAARAPCCAPPLPARPPTTEAPTRSSAASAATCARPATCCSTSRCWSCCVGFAWGSLYGYKGGVIIVVGDGFSNNLTQYDDFARAGSSTPT